jgi:hypothetical protein
VNNVVEDIKMYQKKWLDHLERMSTEPGFPVPTSGMAGYGETETKMERPRIP